MFKTILVYVDGGPLQASRLQAAAALTRTHDAHLSCGAGLVVAGAYRLGRLREWVLGGVTRELLARCPVPLLIAH